MSNLQKGWTEKKLGEICTITSSKRIFQKEYTKNGIPFYRTKEIRELANGKDVTTELFISEERYKQIKVNFGIPIEGDMLLTAIGTIGEIYIVDKNKEFYFKDGNVLWLKDFQSVNTYYLKFALGSFIEEIKKLSNGSTYNALPIEKLKNHKILLPPLEEQKRIAEILDQAEELRRKRKEAIAQLDTLTQSIFLEMFGDPVVNPKGWDIGRLEDIADFQTGYPFKSSEYTTNGETVKLCRGANILPNHLDWTDLALWPKNRTNTLREFALEAGDVVIAMDRPWISSGFKIAQIEQTDLPALLVQRVARLRGKNSYSNSFIFQILKLPIFAHHCKPTETTVPHISPKDIKSFSFPLPPVSLQKEFAQRVEAVEELKKSHRASLSELDALFASLQHRAFKGEL
ncbi:MAG: restriction endonuclease subunit S [Cuspidothrix sp.]